MNPEYIFIINRINLLMNDNNQSLIINKIILPQTRSLLIDNNFSIEFIGRKITKISW